ncbi:soluble scavenger receptor cysteine-rich domain-containing protein SSC5D isoform X1 [Camponotus floridanus]|uniref:soluble scavenger receptor cysteine-rich domain-containing protein SSC5D isoform X1 n=1 Tax=Camponotus floridanus TaxID=104421 RepID=UPI000DC6AC8F|nr:soluble scavenger receptor cysteine-rich domain-containing protein SSC5D isoform X1 [Camponotus floridanus]
MQPLGVLLLLLSCQLATPKPIFDRDGADLLHREYRSAGFGETIRDWFRIIKNRVVGKWQEWFGNDDPPTPSFSPQDIFNIDKTIGNRVPGYPSLFLDLSSISFDPKQDWGVRIGNWYIIRKVTGNDDDSSDSDSDEWDMRSLLPNLPSFPTLGIDWTPNIHEFEIPKTTQLPMTTPKIKLTTPKIELTTPQQTPQTNIQTESVLTESTVILTEPIPFTTQLIATSTEPVVTSTEEILTSTESSVTNDESDTISTESILTSTETIPVSIESTVPSTESVVTSTELITSSTDTTLDSTESIVTSIESVVTVTESIETLTEEIATSTITELSDPTSTEVILPVLNKRIEDNETVNTRTTKKPRPASAEVIMF